MIETVSKNIQVTIMAIFTVMVVCVVIYLIARAKMQKNALASKGKSTLPRHDYSKFNRADSRDCVQFDDIFNVGDPKTGFGILTDNNFHRYVAYISLTGYDFNMATDSERYNTAMNMINVINLIDSPIQIYQDARPTDFTSAKNTCDRIIAECREKKDQISNKINTLVLRLNSLAAIEQPSPEELALGAKIDSQLDDAERELKTLDWFIQEQEIIKVQYDNNTDITAEKNPDRTTLYIIDWHYNENEHLNSNYTRDDIYKEAVNRLWSKTNSFITALSQCGVYARRLNANEILETLRFHFHPYACSQYRTEDLIRNYSFKNLFTTSDFPEELRAKMEKEAEEQEKIRQEIDNYYAEVGFEIPDDAPDIIYTNSEEGEEA